MKGSVVERFGEEGKDTAELLFGTAGIPLSSRGRSTEDGISRIAELGLGCMEVQFVQRVGMGEKGARQVKEVAGERSVTLSAHAPYAINLNAKESDKVKASQERILLTARIGSFCGARNIVFHPAFYLGEPSPQVYQVVKRRLEEVTAQIEAEGLGVCLRPEVMGKGTQFGTLEELLNLSAEIKGILPCIDFSHWHARHLGGFNSYEDFKGILRQIEERLGRRALDDMHMHISGIGWGKGGETKHFPLKESDMRYRELLQALKDYQVKGLAICESPNLEEDALLLQETYKAL